MATLQPVNALGAFSQGVQSGNMLQQIRQRRLNNELARAAQAGDRGALAELAVSNPQAAQTITGLNAPDVPDVPFKGQGFESSLANIRTQDYMNKLGLPQQDAASRAGGDILSSRQITYTDQLGNPITKSAKPLPPITAQEKEMLQRVVEVPPEQRPQAYQEMIIEAKEQGMEEGLLPDEFVPGMETVLADIVQNSPIEDTLSSSPVALAERARLSEGRRGNMIKKTYEHYEKSIIMKPKIDALKESLDSLVERGVATGPAAPVISFLNNLGAQMGLSTDLTTSSSFDIIEGASNELSTGLVKQLGVNPTDKDFQIIKSTLARAATSVPANFAFLDMFDQVITRQMGLNDVMQEGQQRGFSEANLKKLVSEYNKKSHVIPPKNLPSDMNRLKEGGRYVTDRGVFIYTGDQENPFQRVN